jgi:hypothetical protein
MSLGSAQSLAEMSTRNLHEGKERRGREADNFTAICELHVYKMWEPRRLTTYGLSRPVAGMALLYESSTGVWLYCTFGSRRIDRLTAALQVLRE